MLNEIPRPDPTVVISEPCPRSALWRRFWPVDLAMFTFGVIAALVGGSFWKAVVLDVAAAAVALVAVVRTERYT